MGFVPMCSQALLLVLRHWRGLGGPSPNLAVTRNPAAVAHQRNTQLAHYAHVRPQLMLSLHLPQQGSLSLRHELNAQPGPAAIDSEPWNEGWDEARVVVEEVARLLNWNQS